MVMTDEEYKKIGELWRIIGIFEKNEVKAWKSKNPVNTEARLSARMEAYVKLVERYLDEQ